MKTKAILLALAFTTFGVRAQTITGGIGTNEFQPGTGDNSSYTTNNFFLKGWWGMGMKSFDNTVNGNYNFRSGRWDVKEGYFINNNSAFVADQNNALVYAGASMGLRFATNGTEKMVILPNGNVGMGISYPGAKLHVNSAGSSSNTVSQYSGDLIIQGASTNRLQTTGASLEFVIPANWDGNNPWGQARIITVAGNGSDYDATGKLILGTRRHFDKNVGTGNTWNYGDDLVIDGAGKVGIGTLTPTEALSVNGTIRSKRVKVESTGWPDFVFKPTYRLRPLSDLKLYVDKYQHLPEIPSASEVEKNGQDLGEINKILLKKVEELTLYLIEKDKEIKEDRQKIKLLETTVSKLVKKKLNQ